ncbi:type II secretion system F family protein [Kushneria aurantia]|uniref:Type II secretion system F family protein n=1 Tax=Kushneria aurantia TaxID=504092 RepID=A0ABV6FZW5_9GAMM|nr:type II secretion system F family protein [Kushneria aurantia]
MATSSSAAGSSLKAPATFRWLGRNGRGERVRGESRGFSEQEVRQQLSGQGVTVRRISRKRSLASFGNRLKSRDITLFARQMATMIRAGVPILQSLEAIGGGAGRPALSHFIEALKRDVASGMSFSRALQSHRHLVGALFVYLVEAGEQAGALDSMLERIATHKERTDALRARVVKAMYYPGAVVAIGLGVTALLLVKVVPQFERMFANVDAELPGPTRVTIALSEAAQSSWWQVLLILVGGIVLLRRSMRRSPRVAFQVHRLILKLPILGVIQRHAAIARFTRTLATTFAAGVPLMSALETAGSVCGNLVYERAIERVRQDVSSGQSLQFALRNTGLFPAMAMQMIAIGEEAGSLETMLNKVADFYESEVENRVDSLTSLMEPLIIVVLGSLVGGVVISMYLPVFEFGGAL